MDSNFLGAYREEPREDFSSALYARIAEYKVNPLAGKMTTRNVVLVIAALIILAACVRALTAPRWEKSGNYWVFVTSSHLLTAGPEDFSIPVILEAPGLQEFPTYSVSDLSNSPFEGVAVPTWLPEGYVLDSVPGFNPYSKMALVLWMGETPTSTILLYIQPASKTVQSISDPIAPGSFHSIEVGGATGILVKGNWEEPPAEFWVQAHQEQTTTKLAWDKHAGVQLHWTSGDWFYYLVATKDVSAEDLIRMAESAK
jgi:hypothetical protein